MAGYISISGALPPLGWLPDTAAGGAYPFDYSSDQRFTRPRMDYTPEPYPWNWATMGVKALAPLMATFFTPAIATARLPQSAYNGGNAINVPGGMSFGFSDYVALYKEGQS